MTFELQEWKAVISNFAVITTVVQFISGVLVCRHYISNKTTGESSSLPFITGFFSTSLWLQYGLAKNDDKIILVNSIGLFLFLGYVILFYLYTLKKALVLKQFIMVVFSVILIVIYGRYEGDKTLYLQRLGLLACGLSLCFIAAPLTKLYHVVRVKSTSCLPFPMILMSFVVSLLWLLYGIIVEDPYLQVPNLIGACLAAFQLSLFLVYPAVIQKHPNSNKASLNL